MSRRNPPRLLRQPRRSAVLMGTTAVSLAALFLLLTVLPTTQAQSGFNPAAETAVFRQTTLPDVAQTITPTRSAALRLDTLPTTLVSRGDVTAMDWGDVDGDGDLDLAVAVFRGPNQVYQNDNGRFTRLAWTATGTADLTTDIAWGDLDGDGDLDLAVGNVNGPSYVYQNDNGRLSPTPAWRGNPDVDTRQLMWADLNGDGWLDLLVGHGSHPDQIYANDGTGQLGETAVFTFTNHPNQFRSFSVVNINPDEDDRLDVAFAARGSGNDGLYVYQNDGNFQFALLGNTPDVLPLDMAWGQVTENGPPELALITEQRAGVYQNLVDLTATGELNLSQNLVPGLRIDGQSVAWGDADGDGDLDLALGSSIAFSERLFLNDGQRLVQAVGWQTETFDRAREMAWVDIDQDGDLDLTVTYQNNGIFVYLNRQPALSQDPGWHDDLDWNSTAVALGDVNRDGLLDLAIGNRGEAFGPGQANAILLNLGDGFPADGVSAEQLIYLPDLDHTSSVAWGDVDGDGRLELAVGNAGGPFDNFGEENKLVTFEIDDQGSISPTVQTFTDQSDRTTSLAWGDINNDGLLDLAVGNDANHPNKLYLNSGGVLSLTTPILFGINPDGSFQDTRSLAWGDVDRDGDLDLAVGNVGEPNSIYLNENGRLSDDNVQSFGGPALTNSVAWGDVNGDGRLDLAVGNSAAPNQLFLNIGGQLAPTPVWDSQDLYDTNDLAWGDVDGDGDLDLVAANGAPYLGMVNVLYLNQQGTLQTAVDQPWQTDSGPARYSTAVAWGDLLGNGAPDLVFANVPVVPSAFFPNESLAAGPNQIFANQRVTATPLRPNQPAASVQLTSIAGSVEDGSTRTLAQANLFAQSAVLSAGEIRFNYTLTHPANAPVRAVKGYYSLNGGDSWQTAVSTSDTLTTNLSTIPGSNQHTFTWDVFGSGFFGQSDHVRFRLVAHEVTPGDITQPVGTYLYANQTAVSASRTAIGTMSVPFRVRGNQIQVLFDDNGTETAVSGANVIRIPADNPLQGNLVTDQQGRPYRTDSSGYLQGSTVLAPGDQLVALWPVQTNLTFTEQASLFYLNATPTATGYDAPRVDQLDGVQSLVVSAENPLLLYDIMLSLEWDARSDDLFLLELQESIQRASELLFDVSNGQMALGRVYIYNAKAFWGQADVIVLANNSLRPSAALGGVVKSGVSETVIGPDGAPRLIANAYVPGQVRMGPSWDPFGQSSAELTEDWWRAFAHELAHYLLFLPDNYLGLDNNVIRRIDCQQSFMTTTRDPGYTEFLTEAQWLGDCLQSLAEQTTGRTDWETITQFYPMLNVPTGDLFEGPSNQPLNITFPVFRHLGGDDLPLPSRNFDIRAASGERIRLPNAQVYLIQTQGTPTDLSDDMVVYLGTPTGGGNRIKVRGAAPGDRLCLFDNGVSPYAGCVNQLTGTDVNLPVTAVSASNQWQPIIDIRTETLTRTLSSGTAVTQLLQISLTHNLTNPGPVSVQLYPLHYRALPGNAPVQTLQPVSGTVGLLTGTITLPRPAFDLFVRAWIGPETAPQQEFIAQIRVDPPWQPDSVPIGDPDSVPIGDPDSVPIGDPDSVPIGDPDSVPIGDPDSVPIGDPDSVPIGDPDSVPIGDPDSVPIGDPDSVPIGDPDSVPIGDPDSVPIGDVPERTLYAPIRSADAQVTIFNTAGFFEENGVASIQLLDTPPLMGQHPWLLAVGQAYRLTLEPTAPDADPINRAVTFRYLQRDVPPGYEHTLTVYFLPQGATSWERLSDTQRYPENMVVATARQENGTYALMATIEMPSLTPGWNLFAYPLPMPRSVSETLASINGRYTTVYTPPPGVVGPFTGTEESVDVLPLDIVLLFAGPDDSSDLTGVLLEAETARIINTDDEAGWIEVECPDDAFGERCWLDGNSEAFTVIDSGQTETLPNNTTAFEFGRVYLIFIAGETAVTPYLAPPRTLADGSME